MVSKRIFFSFDFESETDFLQLSALEYIDEFISDFDFRRRVVFGIVFDDLTDWEYNLWGFIYFSDF